MRLTVSTPTAVIEDIDHLTHVRLEDETGAFGLLPGHTDLVTVLPVSVVTWRADDGREGFVLVRESVLTMRDGNRVEIAARGAYRDEKLHELGTTVLEELRRSDETEDVSRTSETRLHLATMRQIEKVLRAERGGAAAAPRLSGRGDVQEPGA